MINTSRYLYINKIIQDEKNDFVNGVCLPIL